MDAGQSSDVHASAGEDEGETVEIKIKTLDAQSYTLRVDKNTSVPALKDQIASVVGVPVENQRLICRGKVLKDDQLLGAYNVEDGHTLHLVARQPPQPSPPSSTSGQEHATGATAPSDVVMVSPRNRPGHVSHSLLMGTINIPDSGEGGIPDLSRIISAVLNSVGMGNAIPGATGTGGGSVAVGVLPPRTQAGSDGQPQEEGADGRSPGAPGEHNDSADDIEAQLQLDAIYGVPSPGIFAGTGAGIPTNAFRIVQQQPTVVPDALTTMSQYLDRLEQSFSIIEGGRGENVAGGSSATEGAVHVEGNTTSGQTSDSLSGRTMGAAQSSSSDPSVPLSNLTSSSGGQRGQSSGVSTGPVAAPQRRVPTPSSLGTIVHRVQHLLSDQAGTALARLAAQLENEPNLVDAAVREEMQRTALRDGNMMQQLGALLLELGRTTLTLRMGQSPAESVVNAGPAVFISPSGPNPMMVQSLPSQTGVALGALPPGTPQTNGGVVGGPSLGPRSINIHIHASDLRLPSPSPSATPPPQQPPSRAVIGVTSGAPVLTVRNVLERADATSPERALTVRQIIERAEAATGGQQGNTEMHSQGTSGGAVQGAIMTFNENGAMRVVPVRTRSAGVPMGAHPQTGNEADSIFQPLVARFQQQLGSGRSASTPPGSTMGASTNAPGPTSSGEHPPPSGHSPSVRAQVHIQAWAPSIVQALGGLSSQPGPLSAQPVSGGVPVGEAGQPSGTRQGHTGGASDSQRDPSVQVPSDRGSDEARTGQPQEGLVQGVDVAQIVDSLGPFLNQLAVVFQQARPQQSQPPSQQPNEQPAVSQPNVEGNTVNVVTSPATASPDSTPEINGLAVQDGDTPIAIPVEQPHPGADVKSEDKMDVSEKMENAEGSQDGPASSSTSSLPVDEQRPHEEDGQRKVEDQPVAVPIGLGLGGLQPLPARTRRVGHTSRAVQRADMGGAATATDNGLPVPRDREQILAPSNRPEDNAMGQLPSQLTQGLLPLLGNLGNRGSAQGGEGNRELGELMGQLMSRRAEESGGGQGAFPGDMLRGMMGQLVQSPIMENLVQSVMAGVQNDEARNADPSAGHGNRGQGPPAGFDFAGVLQQMLPVMSQMFGGRPASNASQHLPRSTNTRNHNDDSAARDSPGQINDSGRWREALSEEEVTTWSETIAADMEQQQSMEPQRPFSDVYVRGSPLAKRRKTELEGTPHALENGGTPEEVVRSAPAQVGASNGSTNGEGIAQFAQQTGGADGMADA